MLSMQKILALVLVAFVCKGFSLDCYTYVVNNHQKIPSNESAPLQACTAEYQYCATLGWTSTLTTGEQVKFQQGLCATHSVCKSFCKAVYGDPQLGKITNQCQHQCCNGNACNRA